MKGYKVFNPDFTCLGFKFEVGKTYKHDGETKICESGFHFYTNAADCFSYYSFDPANIVCEVESGAVTSGHDKDSKQVTNELTIVRQLEWLEVLSICNTGKCNTGKCNTGNWNTGNWNTGKCNTGDRNTGNWNTGNWNTGKCNTGNGNTGDGNTGYRNTGNWNTGNWNTGDGNTGNGNTGNGNTGNWNTGIFNTNEPNMRAFNKKTNLTMSEFVNSDLYIHFDIKTIDDNNNVIDYKRAWANWWDKNKSDNMAARIKKLPNFDAAIFKEITGIEI